MQISEKLLLIITAIVTALSAFFCVIGLATPRWSIASGLFCAGCSTSSSGLSIIAFLLLVASVVILGLFILRILPPSIRIICLIVLFLANIFTLSTFAAYVNAITGYSYKLMVFAHFLCYVASILAAFWLGTTYTTNVTQTN
ncbi:hypothetical protein I4U23_030022 [Adineta vaga]|nr:hypothetical protein I4U23_030022 [Adineta vaga]